MGVLIKDITSFIRNLIVCKTCENPNKILNLSNTRFERLVEISATTSEERLIRCLEVFSEAEGLLRYSNHPRVIFETAAIKCARPDADYDLDALLSRIKQLEDTIKNGQIVVGEKPTAKVLENVQVPAPISNTEKVEKQESVPFQAKKDIKSFDNTQIKGVLLNNLRRDGNEMLWNIVQSINVNVNGDVLVLEVINASDKEYFEKSETMKKLNNALNEFEYSSISINLCKSAQNLDKVDQEIDKIRSIFGEDIVIIKE